MNTVTIATLNLHNRADRWRDRRELIVAELLDTTPTLIALQEIYMPIQQGKWLRNQLNSRLDKKQHRPYQLIQTRKRHFYYGYFEGVGILTQLPVVSSDVLPLGYDGRVALRVNIELLTGGFLDFVCVHLHDIPRDKEARHEQVLKMIAWLHDKSPAPYQIMAGNFNEVPNGLAIQAMKEHYYSAYEKVVGHEPLATFPTGLVSDTASDCLDYIFVSRNVARIPSVRLFADTPAVHDETLYPSAHVGLLAEVIIESIV